MLVYNVDKTGINIVRKPGHVFTEVGRCKVWSLTSGGKGVTHSYMCACIRPLLGTMMCMCLPALLIAHISYNSLILGSSSHSHARVTLIKHVSTLWLLSKVMLSAGFTAVS